MRTFASNIADLGVVGKGGSAPPLPAPLMTWALMARRDKFRPERGCAFEARGARALIGRRRLGIVLSDCAKEGGATRFLHGAWRDRVEAAGHVLSIRPDGKPVTRGHSIARRPIRQLMTADDTGAAVDIE